MMEQVAYKQKPEPGDLIEIDRMTFKHWAVYVGRGCVVHLLMTGEPFSSAPQMYFASVSQSASNSVGIDSRGEVKLEKLEEVVGNDPWKINNSLDARRKPYKPSEIVRRAYKKIGKSAKYNLVHYNCEHFAKELRYGVATSGQVNNAVAVGGAFTGIVAALAAAAVGVATVLRLN